jgi:hypothetical protein
MWHTEIKVIRLLLEKENDNMVLTKIISEFEIVTDIFFNEIMKHLYSPVHNLDSSPNIIRMINSRMMR